MTKPCVDGSKHVMFLQSSYFYFIFFQLNMEQYTFFIFDWSIALLNKFYDAIKN